MYLPKHFALTDPVALRAVIAANPFATLVTSGSDGLDADHLPLLFELREAACLSGTVGSP